MQVLQQSLVQIVTNDNVMFMYSYCHVYSVLYVLFLHRVNWHSSATLTEGSIIIFIKCNWVVTLWQWLFYMCTKHEICYY